MDCSALVPALDLLGPATLVGPVVAPVARDALAVVGLLAREGMVAVVVPEGTVAVVALARPGMPELSELSSSVPAALPVVGRPGSTGCELECSWTPDLRR
jgi:hypothetical protein